MPSAFNASWTAGSDTVTWTYQGREVVKSFEVPPSAVALWDNPLSIIVVESIAEGGRLDNVIVFDVDGVERLRLKPPDVVTEPSWRLGYYTVYVSGGVLVAVFSTTVGDFWGEPDLETGELLRTAQWR